LRGDERGLPGLLLGEQSRRGGRAGCLIG
jgi:hypothetical protein